jgi:tetratricopeptide (TPR) repeat protein
MRDEEAVKKYLEALKLSPNDITALVKTSEMNSIIGNRQKDKKKKEEYYNAAKTYAASALKVNPADADANYVMALAMGRMALMSSGKEKVKSHMQMLMPELSICLKIPYGDNIIKTRQTLKQQELGKSMRMVLMDV